MSKYIDEFLKQALWQAYGRKCFYCREPLLFKNIHIDHVIPQKAFKVNKEELIARYCLCDSFDFNSLSNFAPACQSCNSARKGHKELEHGIPMWLNEISSKLSSITETANRLEHELSLDLPNEYHDFFVSSPDFLLSKLTFERIRKKDIEVYKQLTFNSDYFPLKLWHPINVSKSVVINNLRDYEDYSELGYYPLTTPCIAFASKCEACLNLFDKFENAIPIIRHMDLADYFKALPARILSPASQDYAEVIYSRCNTILDYLNLDGLDYVENSRHSISIFIGDTEIESRQESFILEEVLQADFTGNGKTEVMLFIYFQSGGTLSYFYSAHCVLNDNEWIVLEVV